MPSKPVLLWKLLCQLPLGLGLLKAKIIRMFSLNHLDVKISTFDAEIDVANGLAIVVYDLEVVKPCSGPK